MKKIIFKKINIVLISVLITGLGLIKAQEVNLPDESKNYQAIIVLFKKLETLDFEKNSIFFKKEKYSQLKSLDDSFNIGQKGKSNIFK